ncbi:MAG: hypothetical protein JO080_01905 [Mucilaginibacter sp.]|nr:hypothetical protein [Mucilaginibacter sp.]
MRRLRILTVIAVLLAIVVFLIKNRKPSTVVAGKGLLVDKAWMITNQHPLTAQKDVRPPDQTFLTYPEWFLVFSPAEQADYLKTHTSTTFPYLKHVDQMWKGYHVMYNQIKGNYPFNTGYHLMIVVITGSTTVEYGIKSFYETIIGRITDTKEAITDEDKFNAGYEGSYVKFIEDLPWYEYDFNHQLKSLWSNTSLTGPYMFRKWERKYYLTTELMIKSGYGWLIKLATKSAYETALLNTSVVTEKLPVDLHNYPEISNAKHLPDGSIMMDLPRYARFKQSAGKLAGDSVSFKEIAGNTGAILLTVITKDTSIKQENTKQLFYQPIYTKPGLNRVALVTTVSHLNEAIMELIENKVVIEHIYDF